METESKILGVSMRGWITFIIVIGTFALAIWNEDIRKVIPYGFTAAISYYYGQKSVNKEPEKPKEEK